MIILLSTFMISIFLMLFILVLLRKTSFISYFIKQIINEGFINHIINTDLLLAFIIITICFIILTSYVNYLILDVFACSLFTVSTIWYILYQYKFFKLLKTTFKFYRSELLNEDDKKKQKLLDK